MCSSKSHGTRCVNRSESGRCAKCEKPRRLVALEQLHLHSIDPVSEPEFATTLDQAHNRELEKEQAKARALRRTPTFL